MSLIMNMNMNMIMIMIMNMNMNMNISVGRRIAASACRRSLTSLYTIHVHLQMEQIFQSIYAYVIIVLSQCRCLRVYHLGLTTAPGKQLTGERRKETRPGGLSRISCRQLLRWQRNNLCLRSYCLLPNVKTSKRLCVTRNKEV
jgi:hypothetical protein